MAIEITESKIQNPKSKILGVAQALGERFTGGPVAGYLVFVGLMAGLAAVVATVLWYADSRRPVQEIPVLQELPVVGQITGPIPPHYLFAIYGVTRPVGVAVSPSGDRIYSADNEGPRLVRAFDSTGKELFSTKPLETPDASRRPGYLALAPGGLLYVSDLLRGEIEVYSPEGKYVGLFEPDQLAAADGWAPGAVAFDGGGRLLVANMAAEKHSVLVLEPGGKLVARLASSGNGPGQLDYPNGLLADPVGPVIVSDSGNQRVQFFEPDGKFLGILPPGSAFSLPRGLALTPEGRLYVVDSIGQEVRAYDLRTSPPSFLFAFGQEGLGDGQFRFPVGIAVDRNGRLYIADTANNRLQVWGY